MLNGLILKVTKFQLPPPKHLGRVVKNIFGGHHGPPMSNRVNPNWSRLFLLFEGPKVVFRDPPKILGTSKAGLMKLCTVLVPLETYQNT